MSDMRDDPEVRDWALWGPLAAVAVSVSFWASVGWAISRFMGSD